MAPISARKIRKAFRNPSLVKNRLKKEISDRRWDARFGRGRAMLPSTLFLAPTFRCNLDCLTCSVAHNVFENPRMAPGADFREEMSWEEWVPVLDEIGGFRPTVLISGGEPLVSPLWLPMVERLAGRHGVFVSLATNGMGFDEVVEDALRAGVRHIHLSIDGWGEAFDAVRGEGSFRRLLASLEALTRLRRDLGDRAPGVSVICAITPFNVGGLERMFRRLQEFEITDLLVQHLVRITEEELRTANQAMGDPRRQGRWTWGERLDPTSIDVELLREQLSALRARAREVPTVKLRIVPDLDRFGYEAFYSPGPMPPVEGFHCYLFWTAAYIFPDGSVMPSQICYSHPAGNVRRARFREIWNGEEYRWIRRDVWSTGWRSLCGHCFQPYGGCL